MINDSILCVVDNVIRIKKETCNSEIIFKLKNHLSRENPQYHLMNAMAIKNPRMRYAPLPPRWIESWGEDSESLYIPRGSKEFFEQCAREFSRTIRYFNRTIQYQIDPIFKLKPEYTLVDYQFNSVLSAVSSKEGIICCPCGGGKTMMGIAIATAIGQPTLIIVHTHDLLNQWVGEWAEKTFLPQEVGVVGAGKKNARFVTVATIQTLYNMGGQRAGNSVELDSFLGRFGTVILDECHHVPADSFLQIMNRCPSENRFGLTATPKRKDGKEFLMFDCIGPIISEVQDGDLISAGRSQTAEVNFIKTNFSSFFFIDNWAKLIEEISNDEDRNNLIIQNIVKSLDENHFPLVLSQRVAHCKHIQKLLGEKGINSELLIGEIPKNIRQDVIKRSKLGLVECIIATRVADEGLDIPNLSCLHLATPTGNRQKLQQQTGRIRRPIEGKKCIIYDYCDINHKDLLRMFKERSSAYRSWGFAQNNKPI